MKITTDFAPPLSVIAPFFLMATIFGAAASLSLFWVDVKTSYTDFKAVGWVHLFLLGFVMTVILGSMAQLIPVVLEKGHSFVRLFGFIPYLFSAGTIVLVGGGFWFDASMLPYGGALIAAAIFAYLADVFATLFRAKRSSLSVGAMWGSHIFLAGAVAAGFLMALAFGYGIDIDIRAFFVSHVAFGVGGYMFLVVIGVAVILLPMFGLAHGFDMTAAKRSAWSLSAGVLTIFVFSFSGFWAGVSAGFLMLMLSVSLFVYQVFLMDRKRVRKEREIWYRSLSVSFASLSVSLVFMLVAALHGGEKFIKLAAFIFGMGFLFFLITGHLYKIIPFLVWFERFSPLVGKKKVPMLNQMLPKKAADYQLLFGLAGLVTCCAGILTENRDIWFGGVSFLSVGSMFLLGGVVWMIRFGEGE